MPRRATTPTVPRRATTPSPPVASLKLVRSGEYERGGGVPHSFCLCPITLEPMTDPVVAADGHTYEQAALTRWLRCSNLSPATGATLSHRVIVKNHALRNAIQEAGMVPPSTTSPWPAGALEVAREPLKVMPFVGSSLARAALGVLLVCVCTQLPDVDLALKLAAYGSDRGAALVLCVGVVLAGLGMTLHHELLSFAAVLAGVPLAALSYCCGMVSAMGNEPTGVLILSRGLLAAGIIFCALGAFLCLENKSAPRRE